MTNEVLVWCAVGVAFAYSVGVGVFAFFPKLAPKDEQYKCGICGGVADREHRGKHVGDSAYGGWLMYHYHEACVKRVLANPQGFTHGQVDFAIEIGDELSARITRASELNAIVNS